MLIETLTDLIDRYAESFGLSPRSKEFLTPWQVDLHYGIVATDFVMWIILILWALWLCRHHLRRAKAPNTLPAGEKKEKTPEATTPETEQESPPPLPEQAGKVSENETTVSFVEVRDNLARALLEIQEKHTLAEARAVIDPRQPPRIGELQIEQSSQEAGSIRIISIRTNNKRMENLSLEIVLDKGASTENGIVLKEGGFPSRHFPLNAWKEVPDAVMEGVERYREKLKISGKKVP